MDEAKKETIGIRPENYSIWHRSLGAEYPALDIDFVEFRKGKIVAFFGVTGILKDESHIVNSKRFIWNRTEVERKILLELSQKVRVPSFFVIHTDDMNLFHVHKIGEDLTKFTRMNQSEYADFIKGL